jgi:hypothetical protein
MGGLAERVAVLATGERFEFAAAFDFAGREVGTRD